MMEERQVQYARNKIFYLKAVIIPAIILFAIDYSFWKYTHNVTCYVSYDEYHYNSRCDTTEDDLGEYNHKINYKTNCNDDTYIKEKRCVPRDSDSLITGSIHDCWTDQHCSITPIFYDPLYLWPYNIRLVAAMILIIITIIISIQLTYCSINIYQQSTSQFWNVILMIFCQRSKMEINPKIHANTFIHGYFRQIQIKLNLEDIIIPIDIMRLCLKFCLINYDTINQYTVSISCPLQNPIQNVAERTEFCQSSIKSAIKKKKNSVFGLIVLMIVYIAIYIKEQVNAEYGADLAFLIRFILVILGIICIVGLLYSWRCCNPSRYWDYCCVYGLHFDLKRKWVKHIKYCAHYGKYPDDIHEPIIYTKNIGNVCQFQHLKKVYYTLHGDDNEYLCLQLEFFQSNGDQEYRIHIASRHSYQNIVSRMKEIMRRIDESWITKVEFQ